MTARNEMGMRTPPPTEMTSVTEIEEVKQKCNDHKFYPVRLMNPKETDAYYVLYVACPNCGAFRWMQAHLEMG